MASLFSKSAMNKVNRVQHFVVV